MTTLNLHKVAHFWSTRTARALAPASTTPIPPLSKEQEGMVTCYWCLVHALENSHWAAEVHNYLHSGHAVSRFTTTDVRPLHEAMLNSLLLDAMLEYTPLHTAKKVEKPGIVDIFGRPVSSQRVDKGD
jgi:hypothetical protein